MSRPSIPHRRKPRTPYQRPPLNQKALREALSETPREALREALSETPRESLPISREALRDALRDVLSETPRDALSRTSRGTPRDYDSDCSYNNWSGPCNICPVFDTLGYPLYPTLPVPMAIPYGYPPCGYPPVTPSLAWRGGPMPIVPYVGYTALPPGYTVAPGPFPM